MAEKNEKETNQPSKKKSKTSHKNIEFSIITYMFLAIFIAMMIHLVYFNVVESEEFINSYYNTRQEIFEKEVVRGDILSSEGYVLATTVTEADGSEVRNYPYNQMFFHVVGYADCGKTGIESLANFYLLRSNIFFTENITNELQGEKDPGDNVVTTLNFSLQEAAYKALGDYDGAVVVLEPSTGKILAMVSKPDYNPNHVKEDWEYLTSEDTDSSALVNRATQGLYPPGSTFKIITALEYMRENENYADYSYQCNGKYVVDNSKINCYNRISHGNVNLEESFADSCNSSFANIGTTLDITSWKSLCDQLLFNQKLPISFEYSMSSFSLDEDATTDDVLQTAIGQGKTLVSPMHMAMITAAIANDGVLMSPYVVDHTENYKGVVVKQFEPSEYARLMTSEEAATLEQYMAAVVDYGTADDLADKAYEVYGKTGSAEFSSNTKSSHAWFVGYSHLEGKEDIAVAVVVEDSGSGSKYAVPIAEKIFDVYYQE